MGQRCPKVFQLETPEVVLFLFDFGVSTEVQTESF
jgi:hypothetical protein